MFQPLGHGHLVKLVHVVILVHVDLQFVQVVEAQAVVNAGDAMLQKIFLG